jgi:hypothetical protein
LAPRGRGRNRRGRVLPLTDFITPSLLQMKARYARRQKAQTSRGTAPLKWCVVCGREITWRRKWCRDWGNVKYCSDKCRASGLALLDIEIEKTILKLLQSRPASATICPSEAARALQACEADDSWKALMEPIRRAARRLSARGEIVWLQGGRPVGPSMARGPFRLKLTCSMGDSHDHTQAV